MPIYVAITRRALPGREEEFQNALRDFLGTSFTHNSVHGASMLVPPPGSTNREYGILRTFATHAERDAFYASDLFKQWAEHAQRLTEGEPEHRELHGLEAWFRSPHTPPPRWKMAIATAVGVYPTSLLLGETLGRVSHVWPVPLRTAAFAVAMVVLLTWVVMPVVSQLLNPWLHPETKTS